MRFPIFVWVLSLRRPKIGMRMRAATLSRAIMMPTRYWTFSLSAVGSREKASQKSWLKNVGHQES